MRIDFYLNDKVCCVEDSYYYKWDMEGKTYMCDKCENIACSNNGGDIHELYKLRCVTSTIGGCWKKIDREEFLTLICPNRKPVKNLKQSEEEVQICSMLL